MKTILFAVAVAMVLAGCGGKENYADPQKFVDHYGQEMLGEYYKDGMELMGYKGFEFTNAKVGINRNGLEYVSALVSLIVPNGATYYRRLSSPSARGILDARLSDTLSRVVDHADEMAIREAYRKFQNGERAPVVYSAKPVDIMEIVSPWRTIRVIRLKDGEGMYHPAGDFRHAVQWYDASGDEMSERSSIPNEPFDTGDWGSGLLSEKAIKQLGAVQDGTSEGSQKVEAYFERLKEIDVAIQSLNACCVTQAEIVAVVPSYVSTNALPQWVWDRRQKEASAIQETIRIAQDKANRRNREAKDAVRAAQNVLGRLKSQTAKAEKTLAWAKKNLEKASKQLERLTVNSGKFPRPVGRTNTHVEQMRERVTKSGPQEVSDAEVTLADLKAKVQSAEVAVAEAEANRKQIDEEGRAAVAKAELEGQRALDQATKRLQDEYQVIRQSSTAQLETAVEDCKRLLRFGVK